MVSFIPKTFIGPPVPIGFGYQEYKGECHGPNSEDQVVASIFSAFSCTPFLNGSTV